MVVHKVGWEPTEKLLKKLEDYRGKWVVIVGEDVVISDEDPEALERKIDEQHLYWDPIDYVPTGEEPPLIL